ncbi:MAG: chemotaxis protein CheX [Leptospiraceae bacterium]|nr:chemotaxis protein CheX [Leptospiraceae bacterium]MDW7976197.1 chemotaxis protein CheX [Leptospiraceae bacterium]
MDPLLDEKLIVVLSQIVPEYFLENYDVILKREAFGPSMNEGICYEFCSYTLFYGRVNGRLFFGMDGATKLKLLPHLSKHYYYDMFQKGMANSLLLETLNQIASLLSQEFSYANIEFQIQPPELYNHKVFYVDFSQFRQYTLIFDAFKHSSFLGRTNFIFLLEK